MRALLDVRLFLAAGLALSHVGPAIAQGPETGPDTAPVRLHVMVVHALREKGTIDPECRDLPRRLGPLQFGGLHLIQQRHLRLHLGQRAAVSLPDGREVRMLPLSIVKKRLFMNLEMPGQVNGQLRLRRGHPIVLGGQRHRNGHLIVYIEPDF